MTTVAKDFGDVVEQILKEDKRYEKGAYYFIRNALEHTLKNRKKTGKLSTTNTEHVTGQELIDGMCEYALDQYGPMAITVFENWGVTRSEDFGEIVFNLVEYGVFGKTGTDTKEDFKSTTSFEDVFKLPYLSKKAKQRLEDAAASNKKVLMVDKPEVTGTKRKTLTKRSPNGDAQSKKSDADDTKEDKGDENDKGKPKSPKA